MSHAFLGCITCLAVMTFSSIPGLAGDTVPLDVELKLTDQDYKPLAGVPVRLVFGTSDWQVPNAGTRVVTTDDGTARLTAQAVIDRRWNFSNIGFTPFSMPFRADHLFLAAELEFIIPRRNGADAVHQFLYTADIDRMPDGDCSTLDLDKVYEAGPDGRFTRLVGSNAAGPNFDGMIEGWRLESAGYRMWDSMLTPVKDELTGTSKWHLKLGLIRRPKPVLVQ
ncbi:hypothetical protein [Bradyrhizobium iriomotense]|uniref:Uncharacterized protein n=1 Tax=Bradyrhizobium iriomotense TaxID=441950 RepID=A0ABQ6B8Q1_9BRAD|nr:hypothetical protein [Bradyrhizobium iriomotense]GLR90779.1 hypothetical protein GCM10007857_74940 [Bradyrhizobium iriomotense]